MSIGFRNILGVGLTAIFALALTLSSAWAQEVKVVKGKKYTPSIWVDPDGCEHWVMDDGWEGYMTPNVKPDGKPVCRKIDVCAVLPSDLLFDTDKYEVKAAGRRALQEFFKSDGSASYVIIGHTDSVASDAYNLGLSHRRANSVAAIAKALGANVAAVKGYGERQPKASNATAAGRAQNRRVEIQCAN